MAYVTGTATDHMDLWSKLLSFLQTNADLVAAGQNWTVAWQKSEAELVLRATGLSGQDTVLVGLRRVDTFNSGTESAIWLSGCTAINPSAQSFSNHVHSLVSSQPAMFLDHAPMAYWMVANGRRFVVVVKMGTTYNAMYGGFFLPYGSPVQYPFPLFVGGSFGSWGGSSSSGDPQATQPTSWKTQPSTTYRHFMFPAVYTNDVDPSAFLLGPDSEWYGVCSSGVNDNISLAKPYLTHTRTALIGPRFQYGNIGAPDDDNFGDADIPWTNLYADQIGYETTFAAIKGDLDLNPVLFPAILTSITGWGRADRGVLLGELDGCYAVGARTLTAEDIVSSGGTNYLVVPNVNRSEVFECWCLALGPSS